MPPMMNIVGLIAVVFAGAALGDVQPRCEPIVAPMCKNLGYNTTHMPNFVGDQNQSDAILGLEEFNGLLGHKCSRFLRLFVCSVYVPLCSVHVPGAVPACRGLCQEVMRDCLPALRASGLTWPSQLNCSRFPEPPDLCMQQRSDEEQSENASGHDTLHSVHPNDILKTVHHNCPANTVPFGDKCLKVCGTNHKFTEEEKFIYDVWIAVWSVLSLIVLLFALTTFIIQPKRFRWPARPILYLTGCGFFTSFICFIRWISGSLTCSGDAAFVRPYDSWLCIFVSLLATYCDFAFALWWFTFSYVWYLSASKEWSTEAIEKVSARIHSIVWTVSVVPIIYALESNSIHLNDFTGFCEVFSLILLCALILIVFAGVVLAIITSCALQRVRIALECAGRSPYKLERLIYRLGLISMGISLPLLVSLVCYLVDGLFWVEMLKVGAKFLSISLSSFWVFSYKTIRSWNKILKPHFTHKGLRHAPVTKV